ncbi:MAG: hypothetical protein RBS72_06275 [Sedimentisphaerales bacterium]|nr:hypothetical protein [Sedimentisphaerales bacterium]HNY79933.1 hypothetical protein [Sedimentisphaerales bacterium]HOC65718.1 hypothetical protein [Sedimentisphaerales bacterium]HOH63259.1 hypothetical protein [Sedimentisphaerales bacterium]HPY52101.1 hypothetical protein [Sedimentisphaerales bacterium]
MRCNTHRSALLLTLGLTIQTLAQSPPPAMSLNIEQVALFKNGLGFFTGQVTCPAGQTQLRIALPAAPAHGTLWISYPAQVDVASVVAKDVDSTETQDAITIPELLQANVGRSARIACGDREITGVITYFAQDRQPNQDELYPPRPSIGPARGYDYRAPQQPAALATIQTDSGLVGVDPRAVTSVTFTGSSAEQKVPRPVRQTELDMRLNRAADGRKLAVTFLAKGVTWAPSYLVDITEEGKARISAKALVINDACELKDVAAQLVTGFPHLQFADILSPIGLRQTLAQFLQSLNQPDMPRGRAAAVVTQNVMYGGAGMAGPEYGAAEVGAVAEDLFLYPAGKIDLDRGQVAYIPLFTESVPCEHIYQWDLPDYVDEAGRYFYSRDRDSEAEDEQEVWHNLRLTNTTAVPWTTAPGQTVKGSAILGQDTLKYTPPGGTTILRITRAVGVKAEQIELETSRKREAIRMYGDTFDQITVRGDLSILNTQSKAITLEITKTLSGEVKSTDPAAKEEKLAKGLGRMNGLSKLTWTIELPPATERRVNYVYEVYVRR